MQAMPIQEWCVIFPWRFLKSALPFAAREVAAVDPVDIIGCLA
jgi:hypothetical protein